ncbi:MAG: efflux RND transporter periplasmic adaptor subunit [Campylobacterales bacterium]|nr:efflux RND transporter periplasmic adaptor subunit [Campylobacterales bacterium]
MSLLKSSKIVLKSLTILSVFTYVYAANNPTLKQMPAPKADVYIVPQPTQINISLTYPAIIESFQSVKVFSRASGILEKEFFKEGSFVKKGDPLFQIEPTLYKAKLQAAQAAMKIAQATLENAKKNKARIEKLYKSKSISGETYDNSLYEYEKALASLELANAQYIQAQIDLEYTDIKAPISGTIGLKKVDIGNLVTANPPQELVTINQNDKLYAIFSIPFSDYKNFKQKVWSTTNNNPIQISLQIDGQMVTNKGTIDFIDVNVDQATSTVKVKAIIDNTNQQLMAGSFARVSLTNVVQKDVLTIPQKALLQSEKGTIVFVEKDGVATVKPVIIGREQDDLYILSGGSVQSEDKVIVNNFFRVKPGQPLVVDKIINQ